MLYPFHLSAPPALVSATKPLADYFYLKTLPYHIHEVLLACFFYTLVGSYFSPWISSRLAPNKYPKLNAQTRLSWDVHVVSLLQSVVITFLALWVMFFDEEVKGMDWKQRVWGYTGTLGMVQALAAGYFLWDLVITLWHVDTFGWGFVAHAFSALFVFSFGFRPFLNYYGPVFLLYELSSPFLNFHWFFDKLDMTGSTPQLINGIVLIVTFFLCRLVWGTYQSVMVFSDVWKAVNYQFDAGKHERHFGVGAASAQAKIMSFAGTEGIPPWLGWTYLASNMTLHTLNVFWFGKMISAVRKRFNPPFGTRRSPKENEKKVESDAAADRLADAGIPVGNKEKADGRNTAETQGWEVRSRRRG